MSKKVLSTQEEIKSKSKNIRVRLQSKFYDEVGEIPHNEYPRPQFERDSFFNLNGTWDFCMQDASAEFKGYDSKILVPFSPECLLSGLDGKICQPTDVLYYKREFTLPKGFIKSRTFLNFGAVDFECEVKINSKVVGTHKGGFVPFTFDVTDSIKEGVNTVEVKVTDPTDTSYHTRAKQALKNGGIWYTPQSGIWQTVYLESVPEKYIADMLITPDIDSDSVKIKLELVGGGEATVRALDGKKEIAKAQTKNGEAVLSIKDYELWSPENPKLYDLEIEYGTDKIKSYFGMRKFSVMEDKHGKKRLALNNKIYFQSGVLDQGYWSDGMLTPPTDSAMEYDIKLMKDMGFNMLRKHIKIEPLRWYYHCDRLGMIVWQDFVTGGRKYKFSVIGIGGFLNLPTKDTKRNYKKFARQDEEGRAEYYAEMETEINYLKNCVCLGTWVPFNEGWGQFDSKIATEKVRALDPTRIIDSVSGWYDQGVGNTDMKSLHIYFTPIKCPKDPRVCVLSEFGGYSYKERPHVFSPNKSFGYRIYSTAEKLEKAFKKLYEKSIVKNVKKGFSATVYTQVSDVEEEINGFITYDRKVVKIPVQTVVECNEMIKKCYRELLGE